jgi:hypothetical protein
MFKCTTGTVQQDHIQLGHCDYNQEILHAAGLVDV